MRSFKLQSILLHFTVFSNSIQTTSVCYLQIQSTNKWSKARVKWVIQSLFLRTIPPLCSRWPKPKHDFQIDQQQYNVRLMSIVLHATKPSVILTRRGVRGGTAVSVCIWRAWAAIWRRMSATWWPTSVNKKSNLTDNWTSLPASQI